MLAYLNNLMYKGRKYRKYSGFQSALYHAAGLHTYAAVYLHCDPCTDQQHLHQCGDYEEESSQLCSLSPLRCNLWKMCICMFYADSIGFDCIVAADGMYNCLCFKGNENIHSIQFL